MRHDEASRTAKVIAASTLLLASDARTSGLVAPGAAELCKIFLSQGTGDRWLAWSACNPLTRLLWRSLERVTCPGIMTHYWHRKRWIEERCRAAIAAGFGRMLVIGAGFDTLGIRLAREHHRLEILEIDHPATQRVKCRALEASGIVTPSNLGFEAMDFAATRPMSGFESREATIVVMEGFLMYLPAQSVAQILQHFRATPTRLRMIFTFMSRWEDGSSGFRPRSRLVDRWMAWHGEPFKWTIQPGQIAEMLDAHHFDLHETALTGVLEGENLVVCERRESTRSGPVSPPAR